MRLQTLPLWWRVMGRRMAVADLVQITLRSRSPVLCSTPGSGVGARGCRVTPLGWTGTFSKHPVPTKTEHTEILELKG